MGRSASVEPLGKTKWPISHADLEIKVRVSRKPSSQHTIRHGVHIQFYWIWWKLTRASVRWCDILPNNNYRKPAGRVLYATIQEVAGIKDVVRFTVSSRQLKGEVMQEQEFSTTSMGLDTKNCRGGPKEPLHIDSVASILKSTGWTYSPAMKKNKFRTAQMNHLKWWNLHQLPRYAMNVRRFYTVKRRTKNEPRLAV